MVCNLPGFARFQPVAGLFHGQLVDVWVDPGVARAAKGAQGPVVQEEAGPLLEGWVHTLLRTYMAERELAEEIAYWAPAESRKLEVDFVLRRNSELCAIEVKAARRIHPGDLVGLRAVADLSGLKRQVLAYMLKASSSARAATSRLL